MLKRELSLFVDNEKIKDKAMIIALCNELYNNMLIAADSEYIKQCFSSTFELAIASINLQEKKVDTKIFMKLFLDLLKISNIAKISVISEIILHFEKEMDSIMDSLSYVCVISEQDKLPLDKQLDIILEFKKHMSEIQNGISMLFELENTPELILEIVELASKIINNFFTISSNVITDEDIVWPKLEEELREGIKNYLVNKLLNLECIEVLFQDNTTRIFLKTLNKKEQQIWLMGMIYAILGYNANDKNNDEKKFNELCFLLGISSKEYFEIINSLSLKITNFSFDNLEEDNSLKS